MVQHAGYQLALAATLSSREGCAGADEGEMRCVRVEVRGGVDEVRDPPGLVGPRLIVTHRRAKTLRRDAGSTGLEASPGGASSSGWERVSSSTKAAEKTRAGMAISSRCRRRKPIRPNRPRHGGIGPGIESGRSGGPNES